MVVMLEQLIISAVSRDYTKARKLPSPTKSSVDVDFLHVLWELPAVLMVELVASESVCASL